MSAWLNFLGRWRELNLLDPSSPCQNALADANLRAKRSELDAKELQDATACRLHLLSRILCSQGLIDSVSDVCACPASNSCAFVHSQAFCSDDCTQCFKATNSTSNKFKEQSVRHVSTSIVHPFPISGK